MMLYLHGLSPGNHTGYGQVKGTKSSAKEILALYLGLCQNDLTDFDVLLSGYAPSAAAVEAVGEIGMDLQRKSSRGPGSFFWGAFADSCPPPTCIPLLAPLGLLHCAPS